jgi:bifunctional non-homologous end joining protein LigD
LVFDLDPDEGMAFAPVKRAALDLRAHLQELGLDAGLLTTGGKGLHLVVPLRRTAGWETVRGFARTFAHVLAEREPDRFTASISKARRKGRIFVDWLRNERGATAIAPFSARARPGAPVAVPLRWEELERARKLPRFDIRTAPERAAERIEQPQAVSLGAAVVERLEAFAAR